MKYLICKIVDTHSGGIYQEVKRTDNFGIFLMLRQKSGYKLWEPQFVNTFFEDVMLYLISWHVVREKEYVLGIWKNTQV